LQELRLLKARAASDEGAARPAGSAGAERLGRGLYLRGTIGMTAAGDEDYIYDEVTGEWVSAGEAAASSGGSAGGVEVRDAVGNLLADGDQVTLIKDLKVKGAGQTLKRGTLIKSIRLTGDAQEIDCRYEGIKGLVLRAEFVKKR
jgi:protein PhnA